MALRQTHTRKPSPIERLNRAAGLRPMPDKACWWLGWHPELQPGGI
jgi:hypothetical protein